MTTEKLTLEGVFEQMMAEVGTPTADTARTWGDKFPEFRRELAEFIAEWLLQSRMVDVGSGVDQARALANAGERFSRLLQERIDSSFAGIAVTAERRGVDISEVAAKLGANVELLGRLDERSVSLESIPSAFLSVLADALGVTVRAVARWMATGNPTVAFRIEQFEESGAMSFERVWRECGLSELALRRWMAKT